MDVFPLLTEDRYDYARRFNGHKGTDIFAERGTPIVAVEDGQAHADTDPLGGTVIYLDADSGNRYYYAHLDGVVDPLDPAEPFVLVEAAAGDVLGFVGDSGNAKGKQPHLHFQMAVPGRGTIDPFDELSRVDPFEQPQRREPTGPSSAETAVGLGSALVAVLMLWALAKMVD